MLTCYPSSDEKAVIKRLPRQQRIMRTHRTRS